MAPALLHGQSADTAILGLVTDATGAAIPGATVTISQPETGFQRVVETNAEGSFEQRYLRPAGYIVEVGAAGFRTSRTPNVVLQVGQQARLDFRLEVGDVVETVEVTSASPLLETESATLGGVAIRQSRRRAGDGLFRTRLVHKGPEREPADPVRVEVLVLSRNRRASRQGAGRQTSRPCPILGHVRQRTGTLSRLRGEAPEAVRRPASSRCAGLTSNLGNAGGERAAAMLSLIGTAKLNGVDPEA